VKVKTPHVFRQQHPAQAIAESVHRAHRIIGWHVYDRVVLGDAFSARLRQLQAGQGTVGQ
jgi:hypothetical protein